MEINEDKVDNSIGNIGEGGIKKIPDWRTKEWELPEENWDFVNVDTQYYTHGLHPYPARMVPQIAKRLINLYSTKEDIVLDPFCGSGTVLVESRLASRNSIGVDLNPLACLLAKVKSTPINPRKLKEYKEILTDKIQNNRNMVVEAPNLSIDIDFWFKKDIISDLSLIKYYIDMISDNDISDFFKACFSLTIRAVSNTRNGEYKLYRMPKDKLKKHNPKTIDIFFSNLSKSVGLMEDFYRVCDKKIYSKVFQGDSRMKKFDDMIDLIVTSPPYGDSHTTVAYGQFSRLSSEWLFNGDKVELKAVDRTSLGGTLVKEKKELESEEMNTIIQKIKEINEKRSKEVYSFFSDLNECLESMFSSLKENSYCCIVIGNRTVKGIKIPTNIIIKELVSSIGFSFENLILRNIPIKVIPWKNSPSNIPGQLGKTISKENIIILKK